MSEKLIGQITHYFDKVSVAVLKLSSELKVGDRIRIKGSATDFEQEIVSMQVEKSSIESAKQGDDVGLKVEEPVRKGDKVYLVLIK
jgi:U32 family peptidase